MGCAVIRLKDDRKMIMCGKGVTREPCRECGCEAEFLCDYPVGNDKTCDAKLCWKHAHEVSPGIHYCESHFAEWEAFRAAGGVTQVLT